MTGLSLLGFLAGTKVGRVACVIALTLLMIIIVGAAALRRGGALERAAQSAAALDQILKRIALDEEISSLSASERRSRLLRWARQ